jgi:hypothetical protein
MSSIIRARDTDRNRRSLRRSGFQIRSITSEVMRSRSADTIDLYSLAIASAAERECKAIERRLAIARKRFLASLETCQSPAD